MEPDEGPHREDGKFLGKRSRTTQHENQTEGFPQHIPLPDPYAFRVASSEDENPRKRPRFTADGLDRDLHDQFRVNAPHRRTTLGELPPEILQHIFTFLPPKSLGRLICINRCFRSLLDPVIPLPPASGQGRCLTLRGQEYVWATSRKRFLHGFPKPMLGMGELQMWRLIQGRPCEFCGKVPRYMQETVTTSPWEAGPGPLNVRTIWPFHIRSCGRCLEERIVKETDLLVSGSSVLLPGLPFAILTSSLHYVPSAVLERTQPPPQLQLAKYYFKPRVEALKSQLRSVQPLGASALEEWFKGLEADGREANLDAARFDQWELHGGREKLAKMAMDASMDVGRLHQTPMNQEARGLVQPSPLQTSQPPPTKISSASGSAPTSASLYTPIPEPPPSSQVPVVQTPQTHGYALSVSSGQQSAILQQKPPRQSSIGEAAVGQHRRPRIERSKQEVEEAKLARRKEIERRCQEFQPPIKATTLALMDAFKAAIQIPQALNDKAWEVLKPRLLAQRADAERREQFHNAAFGKLALQAEERQRIEEEQRVAEQNEMNMWQELKVPARDRIQKHAQEFIHQTWSDGGGVTKATASKFAAEVLCHVRQRFDEVIAQEDRMLALKGTAFPQDQESLSCRRLKLRDMKWLFEELIRPHTARFGKELFLCRVCDTNQKLFSFEAVIQHYAAKHTHELSHGNAVVYWEADWPTDPPFDPSPNIPWVHDGGHGFPQIDKRPRPPSRAPSSRQLEQAADDGSQARADYVASLALQFWHRTDGIWDLSVPVRIFVVLQHINMQYLRRFNHELELSHFTDVVSKRPELDFLRRLAGFRCKRCLEVLDAPDSRLDAPADMEHSLPDLLRHFHRFHHGPTSREEAHPQFPPYSTHPDSSRSNWKRDMICLPSAAAIKALSYSRGIDRDKLLIIAEAFPEHFTQPMSGRGMSEQKVDHPQPMFPPDSQFMTQQLHRTGNPSVRSGGPGSYVARSEDSVSMLDEYDPHHPAPVAVRRYPQVTQSILSPLPRETTHRRSAPQYSTEYPIRQEYYYRGTGAGGILESSEREAPISHDSVVFSHEDGSSKWSYREPPTQYSETTVGTLSEFRPESKATSRQSQPLAAGPDAAGGFVHGHVQQGSQDGRNSTAAADFLENFRPMASEPVTTAGVLANRSPMAPIDLEMHSSRPGTVLSGPTPARHRMTDVDVDNRPFQPQRYTCSLPLRDTLHFGATRLGGNDDDLAVSDGFTANDPRHMRPGPEYPEGVPERSNRDYYRSAPGEGGYRSSAENIPSREPRYYHEDTYNYDRRYEHVGDARGERYSYQVAPDHYIEHGTLYEPRHVEHTRHPDNREEYVQVVPRGYRFVDDERGLPYMSEARRYIQHDAQFIPAEPYAATHGRGTSERGNRDVIYVPVSEGRRHPSRQSHHDPATEDII